MIFNNHLKKTISFLLLSIAQWSAGQTNLPSDNFLAYDYTISVRNLSLEDGIINRDLNPYKDSYGFIWLNTNSGLQRYDGHDLKHFPEITSGVTGLVHLGEDLNGWLWTFGYFEPYDINFLQPVTGEVKSGEDYLGEELANQLRQLIREHEPYQYSQNEYKKAGRLYFAKIGEISIFDFKKGLSTISVPISGLFFIEHVDQQGNYWIQDVERQALVKLDANGIELNVFDFSFAIFGGITGTFVEKSKDKLYAHGYTDNGNHVYSIDSNDQARITTTIPFDYTFKHITGHWAWAINEDGWLIIDLRNNQQITLNKSDYPSAIFGPFNDPEFLEDGPERILFGGEFGLNIIEIKESRFDSYFNKSASEQLPIANSVRGIHADGNELLFNCEYGGIVRFDLNNPTEYEIFSRQTVAHQFHGRPILKDNDSNIWIGVDGGLEQYSPDFRQKNTYSYTCPPSASPNAGWALWEDPQNCVWGFNDFTFEEICEEEQIIHPSGQVVGQPNEVIHYVSSKSEETIWLCSNLGLKIYDITRDSVIANYNEQGEENQYLPASCIYHMYEESNGDLWLATDKGLIYRSADTGETQLFDRRNGLANENIYAVIPDEYNRLWLSSNYGIMSFDKDSYQVNNYLPKDGLKQEEFNRIAHFKGEDGTIYFGGLNGITAFHPDDFQDFSHEQAQVLLTAFNVFDAKTSQLVDALPKVVASNSIEFRPSDRYLNLSFSLPTYDDSHKTLYGWKIEGIYEDWNYQNENSLQFGSLPYGNHLLRIKAQSAAGGWSPNELAINIYVLKPFYLQSWFLISTLLLVSFLVLSFFRYRTQFLKKKIDEATAIIKEQSEDLRALEKLKSRFFANVSHELRTPLSLMLGPISRMIKNNGKNPEQDQKLLNFLQRNTIHLKGLVNEILDLSKLENNKIELQEEVTLFHAYLTESLSQFYSIGSSESIAVSGDIHVSKDLVILLDHKKFSKVLNNFLSNAIKFSPAGGEVKVIVLEEEMSFLIQVVDQGRGIAQEDLPHVFDRFYQSKSNNKLTEGGTGIGLSMCRELAQLMKGKVWAESILGVGSTFYFRFPKKVVDLPHTQKNSGTNIRGQGSHAQTTFDDWSESVEPEILSSLGKVSSPKYILVVEDNPDLREYYKIILSQYEVRTTGNGQEAIEYLQKNDLPDLIISDLMMPVMDGMELLSRLKSSDEWRHLPVIMLTAKTNQRVRIKALRYGIDDYLNKPFDEEELQVRIFNLLSHSFNRRTETEEQDIEEAQQKVRQFSQTDLDWLESFEAHLLENIKDEHLSIANVATTFAMSKSTLLRQLKRLTGLAPVKYLQELRLNHARQLIQDKSYKTIIEVAYQVGFKDARAFSRSFKKRFGKSPSEMADA